MELLPPAGADGAAALELGGGSGRHLFALKSMEKKAMEERNKARRLLPLPLAAGQRAAGSLGRAIPAAMASSAACPVLPTPAARTCPLP